MILRDLIKQRPNIALQQIFRLHRNASMTVVCKQGLWMGNITDPSIGHYWHIRWALVLKEWTEHNRKAAPLSPFMK